jgi:AcrR family transcriptional regulator
MKKQPHPYLPTEDRRRAIAEAARALIVEKGFEGLRTREIADRVGINVATLHYHVPTKEALIELLAQSMLDEFTAQHMSNPRDGLSPLEQLKLEFSEFRETAVNNPNLLHAMIELKRRSEYDDKVARYINPMSAGWRCHFATILEAGIADGTFRSDIDVNAAALIIVGTLALLAGRRQPLDEALYEQVTGELVRSIRAYPSNHPG